MKFEEALIPATLVKREKRFLVHLRLDDGRPVIAHTNNTGTMRGCNETGSRVWISAADLPHRKLKWTYELVETSSGVLVGINTARAQRMVEEAIQLERIPELSGFDTMLREQVSSPGSRIDLLLEGDGKRVWVEVKNVTLVENAHARFPDAVSARGLKHLRELERLLEAGDRTAMLFVVQRADAKSFGPAEDIDPEYAEGLRHAVQAGVEVYAYAAEVSPVEITLNRKLPLSL